MYDVHERLFAFIEPPAEQWDDHQARLELVTAKLLDMMRECRQPHDLEHEVKAYWLVRANVSRFGHLEKTEQTRFDPG